MIFLDRELATISKKEPYRISIFLLSLHCAKKIEIYIKNYFSNACNNIEKHFKMLSKYWNDCIYAFSCVSIETQVFSGDMIISDNHGDISYHISEEELIIHCMNGGNTPSNWISDLKPNN